MQHIATWNLASMSRELIIKPLDRESVDRAFPLACLSASGLSLEKWRGFAIGSAGALGASHGVLSIQNRSGVIQGLCSYRFETSLRHGRVCVAEDLVALDLMDDTCVADALLRALEDLARRGGAAALRLNLPGQSPAGDRLIARLRGRGHRWESVGLVKELGAVS
jgi:hypothetical protein